MKLPLLAAALVALTLTACDRPKQALPASVEGYGTRTEEGTTIAEERKGMGLATDPDAARAAGGAEEDDYSGPAVLPQACLDGNGNPIPCGQEAHKPAAH